LPPGSEHNTDGGTGPSSNTDGATATGTTTWTGLVNLTGTTLVDTGTTVTVAPGAMITVAPSASIIVKGTLQVQGTAASKVIFAPAQQGMSWGGIIADVGGSIDVKYADITYTTVPISCKAGAAQCKASYAQLLHYTGYGMQISENATFDHMRVEFGGGDGIVFNGTAAQTVTITDSTFHATGGDSIVANGAGNLTFQFNHVYGDGGITTTASGQHCACHFGSTGTMLIDHNIFEKSQVGFMAGGMNGTSKVIYNNFASNPEAAYSGLGAINAAADLSHNYWGVAPPAKPNPDITGNTTNQGAAGTAYFANPLPLYTPNDANSVGPRS
jgi:hypothetical protein